MRMSGGIGIVISLWMRIVDALYLMTFMWGHEMDKYIRKPSMVNAVQWFPEIDDDDVVIDDVGALLITGSCYYNLIPGDWIIEEPNGNKYVVSADEFVEGYTPVVFIRHNKPRCELCGG